ncbi:hypothetical protein [Rhodoferax sp. TS-BS-61-7]|uniref:hypothetical protein n=1 Tax=Rhodoferax sp. TS-BS-61-7 TaxID=2094194 RepID=UPI0011B0AF32|nr:hypothetical protein [Rhodoferax sp. TS-BS-61-7]
MKISDLVESSGWLKRRWSYVFSFGGLFLAIAPWFLEIHVGYCLLLTLIGSAISLIGSYESKAKQFGFQAPFTNDPLGWRKAKKSYQNETNAHEEKPSDKTGL